MVSVPEIFAYTSIFTIYIHYTWLNIIAIRVDNLRVELGARSQGITVTHYTERISLL